MTYFKFTNFACAPDQTDCIFPAIKGLTRVTHLHPLAKNLSLPEGHANLVTTGTGHPAPAGGNRAVHRTVCRTRHTPVLSRSHPPTLRQELASVLGRRKQETEKVWEREEEREWGR